MPYTSRPHFDFPYYFRSDTHMKMPVTTGNYGSRVKERPSFHPRGPKHNTEYDLSTDGINHLTRDEYVLLKNPAGNKTYTAKLHIHSLRVRRPNTGAAFLIFFGITSKIVDRAYRYQYGVLISMLI